MRPARYQLLLQVRAEFETAKASITYVEQDWARLELEPIFQTLNLQKADLRQTAANLEATYVIRLFAAFEAILREYLPQRNPSQPDRRSVYDLINHCASKQHIPSPQREAVHEVREYRNRMIHQGINGLPPLIFAEALASLNRFLSNLPGI